MLHRRRKEKRMREERMREESLREEELREEELKVENKRDESAAKHERKAEGSHPSQWKEVKTDTLIKCEASFFCEVISRLSKEIKCARDLDDLDDIITLASKFLMASAAKDKSIACKMAASKDCCSEEKFDTDFEEEFKEYISKVEKDK